MSEHSAAGPAESAPSIEPLDELDVALISTARLLAHCLLFELDAARLAELREPAVTAALTELGVELPQHDDLDQLAADYCEAYLHPNTGAPPIQSLWVDGQYEGDSTLAVRALAKAAALDFDPQATRGAPIDHLGSLLLLWSAARAESPLVARRIAEQHLAWAKRALAPVASRGGFYGNLARVTVALLDEITSRR